MSKQVIVGIDLGTTYSLVGVVQAGVPTLIPNALGEYLTPSAVSIDDDGRVLVGAAAHARSLTHPDRTAVAFKRDMGTLRTSVLGGRTFRPPELSALVLESLKRDAEAMLGHPVEEAVITVPAYFGDLQRQATRDAASIAGLRADRIINEPTAAALAYGLQHRDRELKAVVLDLGGGTFDVTVLEILEGVIEIQSSAGDARLGGEDFVDAMVGAIADRIERDYGAPPIAEARMVARVREACEQAKRRLSTSETTQLVLPRLRLRDGRETDVELDLARDEIEGSWAELLERIRRPILRALRDAELTVERVDEVLVVGGATRMPCVIELAARHFGRMPLRSLPPDEAVACGAAIQAALKGSDEAVDDLVVTDVAPFSIGIETGNRIGDRAVAGMFTPILERGTVIPTSRVERFSPLSPKQREIEVQIYQGEHAMVEANTKLGQCNIRLPRAEDEKDVDVRFTYDLNGILDVEVTVVATGRVTSVVIEQRPGALTREEVAEARKAMAALKVHPRDSLPNRTAIARADALYAELTGPDRQELQTAIAYFQAALATQDRLAIDPAREALLAWMSRIERR